jgi:hypothetical protein
MSSPTLLVLAAGLGSRYGGIKQMDPVGPCGEFVLDYSIYDAWRAGFSEVVLVIRAELEEPLRQHFGTRLDGRVRVSYTCQRLDDLPPGFALPHGRQKPWGTGHAVWSARSAVRTSFGMINADDFYGAAAYRALAEFLRGPRHDERTYAMVAYRLANTLSPYGSVARGICSRDAEGFLLEVNERTQIERAESGARYRREDGTWGQLRGDEPASLNLWGFHPSLFPALTALFAEFLHERGDQPTAEFYIPTAVDSLVKRGRCRTVVLDTDELWFGMTYKEDRALVMGRIADLIRTGDYPRDLWG